MEAAAHGNSTLGIPKKVAQEFVRADAARDSRMGFSSHDNVTHRGKPKEKR